MTHARFATLLLDHDAISERRRRMMLHGMFAATLSMAAGVTMWIGDKMGISAVTPPENAYAVVLQLDEVMPPPPSPPASPPAGSANSDAATPPEEVEPPEPEAAPLEVRAIDLQAPPKRAPIRGVPGDGKASAIGSGPPGLGPVGGGQCLLPPCIGKDPITRQPPALPPTTKTPPAREPLAAAMQRRIHTPNPNPQALSRTPTGRTHRSSGRSSVSFCIDTEGRTYDVKTSRRFSGDPEVDRICRETVGKWRFRPAQVGGKPRSTCTTMHFDIEFE